MPILKISRGASEDREQVCRLARAAHEESLFSDIPFSEEKFRRIFDNTLSEPETYLGLKVTHEGDVLGFCYAILGSYYIGKETKVVTVMSLVTDPKIRKRVPGGKVVLKLTRGIEVWGKSKGATYVLYHVTSGITPAGTDRFFRKLGMTTLGGNYALKL